MSNSKLNILIAYPYFKKNINEYLMNKDTSDFRLLIDSGAFSAYNSGHKIELNEYCKFLKDINYKRYEAAVQLDVVFNPHETKINLNKMRDSGLDVCPVFTRGDDFDYFRKLIEDKEYIFVGGVQGLGPEPKTFAKKCLDMSINAQVHYLAFVRPDWLNHYKPYSTDSSTWSNSSRFGNLNLYSGNGRIINLHRHDFIKKPSDKVLFLLKSLGLSFKEMLFLGNETAWRNVTFKNFNLNKPDGYIVFISLLSFIKYSVESEKKIGTKIYMAIGSLDNLQLIFFAYNFLKSRNVI